MGATTFSSEYLVRRIKNNVMMGLTVTATLLTLLPLFLVLGFLVVKGAASVNLAFFTHLPTPVGVNGGGMANAIVGTLELVAIACAIGIPIGIGAGLYLGEYGQRQSAGTLVRFVADVLTGMPSIIVGILAYTVIVRPMRGFSALAGGFALGIMMIPMLTRTTEEMVLLVPRELREAALALGIPRWRTTLSIVARTAIAGIVTGIVLAIARVAGETAPLLFTAFGNRFWSNGLTQPVASLTVQVYTYAISPFPDWQRQAWAGALVLTSLVLALEIGVRWLARSQRAVQR
jgi:phosphate transport system permease protein